MLSRFKSSLEKRAPSVIGALRNLRGQPDAPAAVAPPAAVAKPAPIPAVAKPVPAPVAVAKPAPVAVVEPAPAAVVEATPVVAPAGPVVEPVAPPAPAAADATPAASKPTKTPAKAAAKPAEVDAAPAAGPKPEIAKAAAKPAEEVKPSSKPVAAKADAKHDKAPEKAKHQAADTGSTDIGAYIARAKANGRDPSQIKGTEGMNIADDGTPYWGPLENESSREKAAKKLLVIDQFECISCGTCVEQTEKVFYLPIDGKATPIAQDGPMDLIQDAIEACPVTCIHWVTPEEAVERNLTSGVEG